MSLNIKSEPSETSSVVDLSSDEELSNMVSHPVSPKRNILHPGRPGTPETHCSICLEEFTDKCYPNICFHMFCFECLKRWSAIDSTCPLCKKKFHQIYHSLSEYSHEIYEVPIQDRELSPRIFIRPFGELSDANRIIRMNLLLDLVRSGERHPINNAFIGEDSNNTNIYIPTISYPTPNFNSFYFNDLPSNAALRVRIYTNDMWSEPLPDLSGRFRECSSSFYRENPAQAHRLHNFIIRDINAIRSIENLRSSISINEQNLTNMVLRCILNYEIRDSYTVNMLRPYLGLHSAHFCHELYNYAHSPYDLMGYDRNVRYNNRQSHSPILQLHHNLFNAHFEESSTQMPLAVPLGPGLFYPQMETLETIVIDSDDSVVEDGIRIFPEIINLDSSSDNSDVEILSHFRPNEVFSSSRDQPSTSTGNRDSLDRPINRYNLRRRRMFSPTLNDLSPLQLSRVAYPSVSRRERIILDSSSSDEEPPTSARSSRPTILKSDVACGKRKRKIKKRKLKKRKRFVDDSRSENHVNSRSRSYSGSSSSSGDTDFRPNNNCVHVQTNITL